MPDKKLRAQIIGLHDNELPITAVYHFNNGTSQAHAYDLSKEYEHEMADNLVSELVIVNGVPIPHGSSREITLPGGRVVSAVYTTSTRTNVVAYWLVIAET